jgi:hypothetical protein
MDKTGQKKWGAKTTAPTCPHTTKKNPLKLSDLQEFVFSIMPLIATNVLRRGARLFNKLRVTAHKVLKAGGGSILMMRLLPGIKLRLILLG